MAIHGRFLASGVSGAAGVLGVLLLACAAAVSAPARAGGEQQSSSPAGALPRLAAVPVRELRLTSGQLERQSGEPLEAGAASHSFFVRSPTLRARVGQSPGASVGQSPRAEVELELVYLGPTRGSAPLGSGELRRQVGLELRAQDGCNLLYVMWRIEPVQALMVSLKSNPGQQRHSECADRGYVNLEPERSQPLAPLRAGERHVLRARASATELEVWVDGRSHWRGRLPAAAAAFDGPVGVRSDNAELELQLRSTEPLQ